jgi:transmembrane sensor
MNDKYLHFDLNNFLDDPDFIESVKSGETEKEVWKNWLGDHPDQQDAFDQAVKLIRQIQFSKHTLSADQKDVLWNKIDNSISGKAKVRKLSPQWKSIAITGIAASILFIIYFGVGILFPYTSVSTVRTEHVNYVFPDKSNIHLNAVSSFSYNKSDWKKKRTVLLEGEAFFDVVKGNEFRVESKNGHVSVLGTSFNVVSRDSRFEVLCKTGKVLVISTDNDSTYLTAGMGIMIDQQKEHSESIILDADKINSWTNGVFEYDGARANMIFEELERQFDINFVMEADVQLKDIIYTGSFKNNDLEKALHDILWPMHLAHKIEGKMVYISTHK